MIIKLKEPVFGQTHADVRYTVHDNAVFIQGEYGTMGEEGNFALEPRVAPFARTITGTELEHFHEVPVSKGMASKDRGNFRKSDLVAWLNKYGHSHETKSWKDPVVKKAVETEG